MFSSQDYTQEARIKQRIRYDFEAAVSVIGRELVGKSAIVLFINDNWNLQ